MIALEQKLEISLKKKMTRRKTKDRSNLVKKLDKKTLINFYKKNYNKILFVVSCNMNNDYIVNIN